MQTIDTVGDALNIAHATIKSKKNMNATVNMLVDMFISSNKFKFSKNAKIKFKKNKKRIRINIDDEKKYLLAKEMIEGMYGTCTQSEIINFLLINYVKYN